MDGQRVHVSPSSEQIMERSIDYFRPRRPGPESRIEDRVAEHLPLLFATTRPSWTAGSVPIGAGMPDLLFVAYEPSVVALAHVELHDTHILAYLRAVSKARIDTIAERMSVTDRHLTKSLYRLADAQAVSVADDTVCLSPLYRDVLPEIVTIEVKVSNWQKALAQAQRNRLFAHRSYVAIPDGLAARVKSEPAFKRFGIGMLAVHDDGRVTVARRPRRATPSVWTYYYYVARLLARKRGHIADF